MKIDVFTHILPQKYLAALQRKVPSGLKLKEVFNAPLFDLDVRFKVTGEYPGYVEVPNISSPALEDVVGPEDAVELAKIANDELTELVAKYPDRFVGAVACLPMNDIDEALKEVDRAIKDLMMRGVQLYTDVNGYPLDHPKFLPLFEKMSEYNLPIFLHPRSDKKGDYPTEDTSKYRLDVMFRWPFETSVAMARLVFSGVMEKYPDLQIITHHCGAMVPFFEQRIRRHINMGEFVHPRSLYPTMLKRDPFEYFYKFYGDTALLGSTPGLMCGYAFFGADHLVFGTDFPYGPQLGHVKIRETIRSVEEMDIPESDKRKIFEDNARRLLRLPV